MKCTQCRDTGKVHTSSLHGPSWPGSEVPCTCEAALWLTEDERDRLEYLIAYGPMCPACEDERLESMGLLEYDDDANLYDSNQAGYEVIRHRSYRIKED